MAQKATGIVNNFISLHDQMKAMEVVHRKQMEDYENGKKELADLKA